MKKDVKCVAVAMHDFNSKPSYAFSVSAPKDRMTDSNLARYANYLMEIKEEIEHLVIPK